MNNRLNSLYAARSTKDLNSLGFGFLTPIENYTKYQSVIILHNRIKTSFNNPIRVKIYVEPFDNEFHFIENKKFLSKLKNQGIAYEDSATNLKLENYFNYSTKTN